MFTGIVSAISPILKSSAGQNSLELTIGLPDDWSDLALGESVSVSGVCLTVDKKTDKQFSCHLVKETLSKTSFGEKLPGSVNLERSLKASDRLSGHFVLGHVDEVGRVLSLSKSGDDVKLSLSYSPASAKLLVLKGSVTVDGVALTISRLAETSFEVALVPFTLTHTTLGNLKKDDPLNLEFDILGKYVIRSLNSAAS